MFKTLISGLAATALGISTASADMIDRINGDQLKNVLEDAGLATEIIPDASTGAPVGKSQAGDYGFYVRALSCSGAPASCETLVFFANFELGRPISESDYRIVNSFNESQVFGRAYAIPNTQEVGVDYVIELDGGVSEDHLAQNISRWADVISAFVAKFQAGEPTS
ncbi:YbjN domain-containing protein [Hyphococcus sp.]|uniref:YbjN domain-containing protein n=1 Tax=Hyphococcus sp. TaxID=2038636 RepID=UPI003CCC3284